MAQHMPPQRPEQLFIRDSMAAGLEGQAIQQALREQYGLSPEEAEQAMLDYLKKTAADIASENPPERRQMIRSAGLADMLIGGGLVGVALVIFLSTLEAGGGVLLLLSGLVVYGGYRFIEGLWALVRGR